MDGWYQLRRTMCACFIFKIGGATSTRIYFPNSVHALKWGSNLFRMVAQKKKNSCRFFFNLADFFSSKERAPRKFVTICHLPHKTSRRPCFSPQFSHIALYIQGHNSKNANFQEVNLKFLKSMKTHVILMYLMLSAGQFWSYIWY